MRRLGILLFVLVGTQILLGCATVHRYRAYRGKVLELGTDAPIEGAGVLAVYSYDISSPGGPVQRYLGYQAVLTDKEGLFKIPAIWFAPFQPGYPFSWFKDHPSITIYKKGYGNFPGSTNPARPKHVTTDPPLGPTHIIPWGVIVTIWLPKLETEAERREHDLLVTGTGIPDSELPPRGMTLEKFEQLFGRY